MLILWKKKSRCWQLSGSPISWSAQVRIRKGSPHLLNSHVAWHTYRLIRSMCWGGFPERRSRSVLSVCELTVCVASLRLGFHGAEIRVSPSLLRSLPLSLCFLQTLISAPPLYPFAKAWQPLLPPSFAPFFPPAHLFSPLLFTFLNPAASSPLGASFPETAFNTDFLRLFKALCCMFKYISKTV